MVTGSSTPRHRPPKRGPIDVRRDEWRAARRAELELEPCVGCDERALERERREAELAIDAKQPNGKRRRPQGRGARGR